MCVCGLFSPFVNLGNGFVDRSRKAQCNKSESQRGENAGWLVSKRWEEGQVGSNGSSVPKRKTRNENKYHFTGKDGRVGTCAASHLILFKRLTKVDLPSV